MKKLILLALFVIALAQPTVSLGQVGFTDYTTRIAGAERLYRVYVPTTYEPNTPTPLMIFYHGLTANVDEIEFWTELSQKAEAEGFILVYPQALGGAFSIWLTTPDIFGLNFDLDLTRFILDDMRDRYNIDDARIYAAGYSQGAGMAHRVACDLSEDFAAIGVFGGIFTFDTPCNPERAVPVLMVHSINDPTVPYDGQRFLYPNVRDWAFDWAERNNCTQLSAERDAIFEIETWAVCDNEAAVLVYTYDDPAHSWPGGQPLPNEEPYTRFSMNDLLWDFFVQNPL